MVGTIVPASRVEFTILGTGYMARAHEAMGHVRPTAVVNFLQLASQKYRSELYGFMWIMNPDLQGLQFGSAGSAGSRVCEMEVTAKA